MSTMQEYWDACLIRAWRNHLQLLDAVSMFHSITGKRLDECELLRVPKEGLPWRTSARIFAAYYLPKVNDRLWEQEPEKDVALLRKLSQSKYNTQEKPHRTNADRELANAKRRHRVDQQKKEFTTRAVSERNSATDWNTTKGKARVRVRK